VAAPIGGGPVSVTFGSDYAALRRAADALDEAVAEMKTAHAKRVLRYIH
jgi:hypothetical protein